MLAPIATSSEPMWNGFVNAAIIRSAMSPA